MSEKEIFAAITLRNMKTPEIDEINNITEVQNTPFSSQNLTSAFLHQSSTSSDLSHEKKSNKNSNMKFHKRPQNPQDIDNHINENKLLLQASFDCLLEYRLEDSLKFLTRIQNNLSWLASLNEESKE